MTLLRSLLFAALFYLNLIGQLILFVPVVLFGTSDAIWHVVQRWARSSLWLLKVVTGTKVCFTGLGSLPPGPVIVAAKHQAFWDIIALLATLRRPTFIMKKELMAIPLFGWYSRSLGMIPVDREKRGAALASLLVGAKAAVADGRQIVIFPEGTRTRPGADPDYRPGIHFLYARLDISVVPLALNSGLYWPRKTVVRNAGTVLAEFLPPIEPGLPREAMLARLRAEIETRSIAMLREAVAERPDLPVDELVAQHLR